MNRFELILNWVLRGRSFQSVFLYNSGNLHALSDWSDFSACSCGVDIWQTTVNFNVSWLSALFWVGLTNILTSTVISESTSLNSSLLEVVISSKNNCVSIRDLRDLTWKIIFDAWCASMNVGWKRPIAWNDSSHTPSWRFHLRCGIDETGSPGIICIACHLVLRHPSWHRTGSMGKNLLATAHIANFNKFREKEVTQWTSSMVDETALGILRRQGSRGITFVSSQRNIIFDIQVVPYRQKWQTNHSKQAVKDFETSEFHQHTWNCYLMLGFVLAHIPWNPISNLDLGRS